MAKRTSKADLALQEAREFVMIAEKDVISARAEVAVAESVLNIATARRDAYQIALAALERQFTKQPVRPKSSNAPSAGKRSPRKPSGEESKVNTEGVTGNASTVGVCAVPNCGQREIDPIHYVTNPDYHKFHAAIKTKGAGV